MKSTAISLSHLPSTAWSGLAARLFGVVPSILIGGGMTFLSVVIASHLFKDLDKPAPAVLAKKPGGP